MPEFYFDLADLRGQTRLREIAGVVVYRYNPVRTGLTDILYQFDREYNAPVYASDFAFACI